MYRTRRVEDAFEIWLLSRRPWCDNLRDYAYIDQLFDLEIIAFRAAVEWYHSRTPSSRRSQTPRPSMIGAACESYDEALIADILRRICEEGGIVIDASGFALSGPRDPAGTMLQGTDVPSQAVGPRLPVASFQDLHPSKALVPRTPQP